MRKGAQALSSLYVQRREKIGDALDGRGKRAAFAMFYAPLHFLAVREAVRALGLATAPAPSSILDLGCGTLAAGAAWAVECASPRPALAGVERHPWAAAEAKHTLRARGLAGRVEVGDVAKAKLPGAGGGVVAGWLVNELDDGARERLRARLLEAGRSGARVLVVEPIARSPVPWWDAWAESFRAAGGRADEWRFRVELPAPLAKMDRAAKLDHRVLAVRTLALSLRA